MVFDNGNYCLCEDVKSLLLFDNFSWVVQFKINLNMMIVMCLYEYGKMEVGNWGYSSFVSVKYLLINGYLVIYFGVMMVDEFEYIIIV